MRIITSFFICILPYLALTQLAHAEPECMKNSHTEEEINVCQLATAKQLEIQLKELEVRVRARLKGNQLQRFNAAQDSWQIMTTRDCEIEADFYEGSPVYIAIQAQCLQRHYIERLQLVNNYLCPEYSINSGCQATTPLSESLPFARPAVPVVDSPAQPAATTKPNNNPDTTAPQKIEGTTRFR